MLAKKACHGLRFASATWALSANLPMGTREANSRFEESRTAGMGPFEKLDLAQSSRSGVQVGARAHTLAGPMAGNRNLRRPNGALRESRMAPAEQQRRARIHSLRFIGAPQFQARAACPSTSFLGFHCAASITYNPLRYVSPRSTTRAFVYPFAPAHAFVQTRLPHHSQCPSSRRGDRLSGTVRLRRRWRWCG